LIGLKGISWSSPFKYIKNKKFTIIAYQF